jgi:hypothetical protein
VNEDNLNNVRKEASRLYRNKKREYLKDKINEIKLNSKNIRDLYRGITEFKKGYQPKTNLVKDDSVNLLVDPQKFFTGATITCQLLNAHGMQGFRQTEIQTAEPFVPQPSASEVEAAIRNLERYKSAGSVDSSGGGGGGKFQSVKKKLIWRNLEK